MRSSDKLLTLRLRIGLALVAGSATLLSSVPDTDAQPTNPPEPSAAAPGPAPTLFRQELFGVATLTARLRDGSSVERSEAAERLGHLRDARRAASILAEALADESNRSVRTSIVRSLARLARPEATPALLRLVRAGRVRGAQLLAVALGEIGRAGDPRAVVALAEMLQTPGLADSARVGLRRAGAAALPALLRRATEGGPAEHQLIAALGDLGSHQATPVLVEKLRNEGNPTVRNAAIDALARIGDPRAAEPVAALLDSEEFGTARLALVALRSVGGPHNAAAVSAVLEDAQRRGDHEMEDLALHTLTGMDPPAAAAALTEGVGASDTGRVHRAAAIALRWHHRAAIPVLYGLLREGSRADAAINALAAVPGGEGVSVFIQEAQPGNEHLASLRRGLAVALRRWERDLPPRTLRRARRVVAQEPGARGLVLRALARDRGVEDELRRALNDDFVTNRIAGAVGLRLLGEGQQALLDALLIERTPRVVRQLIGSLLSFDVDRLELGDALRDSLWARRRGVGVGQEVALLLAVAGGTRELRRARRDTLGREMRVRLRGEDARWRGVAAEALAYLGDRRAARTILARLDGRHSSDVSRRVMAAAVAHLMPEALREAVRRSGRLDEDPQVRQRLRDAAEGRTRALRPRGEGVLTHTLTAVETSLEGVPVMLRLPDGRREWAQSLPDGLVVLADLPAGRVDVRVQVPEEAAEESSPAADTADGPAGLGAITPAVTPAQGESLTFVDTLLTRDPTLGHCLPPVLRS